MGVGLKESSAVKWRKLSALVLHEEEWTHIQLFCNLLHVCPILQYTWFLLINIPTWTACQQCTTSFLCSRGPNTSTGSPSHWRTLHGLGEGLVKATIWQFCASTQCWYGKTELLLWVLSRIRCTYHGHEYIFTSLSVCHLANLCPDLQVLEPSTKMAYFHQHWSLDLVSNVEDAIQARVSPVSAIPLTISLICHIIFQFIEHFNSLQQDPGEKSKTLCKSSSKCKSAHPNINDTDTEDNAGDSEATAALSNAWMVEWKAYLNTNEDIPEGMGIVQWWGVSMSILLVYVTNTQIL